MKNKILFYCLISIVIVNVISLYLTMLPFYFEKSIFSQNFWQNHNQSFVSLSSISSETTTITHSLTSKTTKKFTLVSRTIQNAISCFALFNNDEVEQNRSLTDLQFRHNKSVIKYSLLECTDLLSGGRYVLWPTSPEEDDFSIAFSIVMYRDVEQFEKLLRSIYRPQNLICIHVDSKASENVWNSVNKIARCLNLQFKNIIVTNSRVHPTWGQYSVLEADLNCMRELHNARDRRKWRYLINLTGQEFPLRTHLELVRILSILNGANLLEAEPFDGRKRLRQTQKIPSGVHMYKGSLHIVVSARFVDFTLNDPRALRLLDYVRNATSVPDEWYFSTMNHNPASLPAPGAFLGAANGSFVQSDSPNLNWELPNRQYPFLNRIKAWKWGPMLCRSKIWRHAICIWGYKDLPFLRTRRELFINKLLWDQQPLALDCLEEWFWNRTVEDFATGPYSSLAAPSLELPTNLTGVWPPSITFTSTIKSKPSRFARPPAPSRIDLDFWRNLKVTNLTMAYGIGRNIALLVWRIIRAEFL